MKRRSGFTLIEVLIVVAIIAVLISILLPAIGRARVMAKRTRETSDTRQVIAACTAYAVDNAGELPLGQTGTGYNMVWLEKKSWQTLVQKYGVPPENNPSAFGCSAWSSDNPSEGYFYAASGGWQIPWIYWGNRPDHKKYKFLQRLSTPDATSNTLLTCFHRETDSLYNSMVPHIRSNDSGMMFPKGTPWTAPDTMCVGFVDGSVEWVPFGSMRGFSGSGSASRFYYAER